MKKIGVIVNPHARKVKYERKVREFFETFSSDMVDIQITKDPESIDGVLRKFKSAKINYIGVAGGDGTLHHVITRAIEIYRPKPIPPILILKGGTMDNVSRSFNLKGKGPAILKRLLKVLEEGRDPLLHERDTMRIEGKHCFLFGIGFIANFLDDVYKYKKGWIGNIRSIAKSIGQCIVNPNTAPIFRGVDALITLDREKLPFTGITGLLAGTVEYVSYAVSPLSRGNEKAQTFHAVVVGLKPYEIIVRLYSLLRGNMFSHRAFRSEIVKKLTIKSRDSFTYTMDGDMFTSKGSLVVEIGERIQFVYV